MKQETNNEMDVLLRRLSRRESPGAAGGNGAQPDEQHLDADELSAFAENVLPAAARARYTEHLAECTSCRKIVTQLSAALGPARIEQATTTVVEASGFKKFLASLFSPLVLRYAVPAIGLIAIAVIGLVVTNQRRSTLDQVALESRPSAATTSVAAPENSPSRGALYDKGDTDGFSANSPTDPAKVQGKDESKEASAGEKKPAEANKQKEQEQVAVTAEQQPFAAGAGAAAASPPAPKTTAPITGSETESRRAVEVSTQARQQPREADRKDAEETEVARARSERDKKALAKAEDARKSDDDAKAGGPSKNEVAQKRAPSPSGESGRRGRADFEFKDDAETRSVSGRRFRKQGNVWIDVDYDSSKGVTTVARNSEQYRALVADEPGIRTIADQLGGEIVVVWKGRTYRIR